ncbi:MAG: hypothetical protein GX447_01715 [Elusimicrobia bacterium]|nr:hypothetical protein [Elusimicrobiota bacterium]
MHVFNYFFTPFALISVFFAIYFSSPEPAETKITLGIIFFLFAVNFYISKKIYSFFRYMQKIRIALVVFNTLGISAIFYFLSAYWAPIWLLFVIPPAAASLFLRKIGTFLISFFSALCMLGIYILRSKILETEFSVQLWAMASCHALFIIIFSMFINFMSETMTRMRDSSRLSS